ncbi:phage tail protein [Actinophytocola sp. KF-1]
MIGPGPVRAAFAAPAALTSSVPKPSSGVFVPEYGMTMWFSVSVGMPGGDLGLWSSCGGLDVKFGSETVKVGGRYDRETVLPGAMSYGNITLERAMTSVDSRKVQDWLRRVAATWVNSAEGGAPPPASGGGGRFHPGTTVRIELFHRLGEPPVASWNLRDVVPVSWSAPKLATAGGTVAIETLVLAHGGFLDSDTAGGSPSVAGEGQLVLSGPDGTSLPFQYSPEKVTVTKMVAVTTGNRQNEDDYDLQISNNDKWTLSYDNLVVEGEAKVRAVTEALRAWTTPAPTEVKIPKKVTVRMGDGRNPLLSREVVLTQVNITYSRFTQAGAPSRATVRFECHGVSPRIDGVPPQWRAAAAAKNVDDPLRPAPPAPRPQPPRQPGPQIGGRRA